MSHRTIPGGYGIALLINAGHIGKIVINSYNKRNTFYQAEDRTYTRFSRLRVARTFVHSIAELMIQNINHGN